MELFEPSEFFDNFFYLLFISTGNCTGPPRVSYCVYRFWSSFVSYSYNSDHADLSPHTLENTNANLLPFYKFLSKSHPFLLLSKLVSLSTDSPTPSCESSWCQILFINSRLSFTHFSVSPTPSPLFNNLWLHCWLLPRRSPRCVTGGHHRAKLLSVRDNHDEENFCVSDFSCYSGRQLCKK